jgi:hypothetical protein
MLIATRIMATSCKYRRESICASDILSYHILNASGADPFALARIPYSAHDGSRKYQNWSRRSSQPRGRSRTLIRVVQFELKGTLNRQAAMDDMQTVRTVRAPQVLRITVVALLLFSCARVIRPLAFWTVSTSPEVAVRCLQVTRNLVLEVGAGAKLIRPSVSRVREVLIAPAPAPSAFQADQTRLFVRIWPELRRSFLRRILPSASDAGH